MQPESVALRRLSDLDVLVQLDHGALSLACDILTRRKFSKPHTRQEAAGKNEEFGGNDLGIQAPLGQRGDIWEFWPRRTAAVQKRARIKAMLAEARSGKHSRKRAMPWLVRGPVGFAFSGKVRFLLGCLLLAGCILWIRQTRELTPESMRVVAAEAVQQVSLAAGADTAGAAAAAEEDNGSEVPPAKPLALPIVGRWFDSYNPAIVGLLLIGLSLFRDWKMSLFALPAALLMVLGPACGIPGIAAIAGVKEIVPRFFALTYSSSRRSVSR